jgi:ankyrin repeat protein
MNLSSRHVHSERWKSIQLDGFSAMKFSVCLRRFFLGLGWLMVVTVLPAAENPLHVAIRAGDLKQVQAVLAAGGIAINAKAGPEESTALTLAAGRGHVEMVRLLLSKGADIDARTKRLETPLFFAARQGHHAVVALLVDAMAATDLTDLEGRTPLIVAAGAGHLEVVKLLLDAGANPNATMGTGESPMFLAVQGDHLEIMKVLLEMGSLVSSLTRDGESPLSVARKRGNKEVLAFLEKNHARIPPPQSGEKAPPEESRMPEGKDK